MSMDSQRGSTILIALMVLLVISILGTAIIDIAGMENKIAVNDIRTEQARQAADAGIQAARMVVMNFLMEGKEIPDIPEIKLGDNISADITVNLDKLYSSGIVAISSAGRVKNTNGTRVTKTAQAEIRVNTLPNYPIQSQSLTVMGQYFATVSDQPALLEGQFPVNLRNIQDWHTSGWDTSGMSPLPQHGLEYSDPGLESSSQPDFIPGNSRNSCNYTWWIDYEQLESGPDLSNSTLNIAPFWKPVGIVNVINKAGQPATIAANNWGNGISPDAGDKLFDTTVTQPEGENYPLASFISGQSGNCNYIYPPKILNSLDFMGKYINAQSLPPDFRALHLERFKKLAQTDPDWQYIGADSPLLSSMGNFRYRLVIDDPDIQKKQWFIDMPDTATIVLDFTARDTFIGQEWMSWDAFDNCVNTVLNGTDKFFNRFRNRLNNIIAVSPASLEVGCDSMLFQGVNDISQVKPNIYLLSGRDINLHIDPEEFNELSRILPNANSERDIPIFILAGRNANIVSTPEKMTFRGVLSAGNNLTIRMNYFSEHHMAGIPNREIEKQVNIIQDEIVTEFPETWAYLGIGPIVSYKYIN